MTAIAWALLALAALGTLAGALGGFFYCRRWLRDRRNDLGAVLVRRSEALKHIDELAGALERARCAEAVLLEDECAEDDALAAGAAAEVRRLDAALRRAVKAFLELNKCAERKGAATATLRPPEAEAVVLRAHVT